MLHLLNLELMENPRYLLYYSHVPSIINNIEFSFIVLVGISDYWVVLCGSRFFISDLIQSIEVLEKEKF